MEFSPHVLKRMEDRRFTEIQIRSMLGKVAVRHPDSQPGRWVLRTWHKGRLWDVIVEPDHEAKRLVVITAYPLE